MLDTTRFVALNVEMAAEPAPVSSPAFPRRMPVLLAVVCLAATVAIPVTVVILARSNSLYADIVFPFVLIAGLIALVSAIALLVLVLKALGLDDARYALGMPDGTVRAIIAVMLILLFAMLAAFLYIDLANGRDSRELDDISQSALDAIPARELTSVRPVGGSPTRYVVTTRVERSQASADVAKQLLTTVSTLVVAISAFYFGAQSAESARRSGSGGAGAGDSGGSSGSGGRPPTGDAPAVPAPMPTPVSGPTTPPSAPAPRSPRKPAS